MKTIGLLGGMSYESTLEYYRLINQGIKQRLGGSHSAKILMYSFDYHELEVLLEQNRHDDITQLLIIHAQKLKDAGADLLVICANTMHIYADQIELECGLPLIHIVKSTLTEINRLNLKKVALLGTMYTMESPMYPTIMKSSDVDVILPTKRDMAMIHRTIYQELILGKFHESSRNRFLQVIDQLKLQGAEGVVLGCTEIPLLIKEEHLLGFPLLNTMQIHAEAAVEAALKSI
jgi:aspartate racemase